MLFSVLPEDLRAVLESGAPERTFGPGQIIQQRGDDATGFWVITSGSVAVGQFLESG